MGAKTDMALFLPSIMHFCTKLYIVTVNKLSVSSWHRQASSRQTLYPSSLGFCGRDVWVHKCFFPKGLVLLQQDVLNSEWVWKSICLLRWSGWPVLLSAISLRAALTFPSIMSLENFLENLGRRVYGHAGKLCGGFGSIIVGTKPLNFYRGTVDLQNLQREY